MCAAVTLGKRETQREAKLTVKEAMPKGKLKQWNDRLPAVALTDVSGGELKRCDPDRHQSIVRGIKEGMPVHLITKVFQVSEHMVQGITRSENIEQDKINTLADKFEHAAHLGMEIYIDKLLNHPEELNLDKLPVNSAIATDKMSELRSRRSATSSQIKQDQTMDALNEIVKKAVQSVERKSQIIDVEPVEKKS